MSDSNQNVPNGTFMYFGYGSNMLEERIHIKNPSARYIGNGLLKKYKFGFEKTVCMQEDVGAAATIRTGTDTDEVRGCVWEIDRDQVNNLDRQENLYRAIQVDVVLETGATVCCRTYEINRDVRPNDTKPHPFYKRICIEGAKQHRLPEEYIRFLESFEDSNQPRKAGYYEALVPVLEKLDSERAKS